MDVACTTETDLTSDGFEIFVTERARIIQFPGQPRKYFNPDRLRELADSILAIGQVTPVEVMRIRGKRGSEDEQFELVDGERRWRACELGNIPHMRAFINPTTTRKNQYEKSIAANFNKESHPPVEVAEGIKKLIDNGKTVKQVAAICGISVPWVYQHLKLLALDRKILELMSPEIPETKRLTMSAALVISGAPPEVQVELATITVEQDLSLVRLKHIIECQATRQESTFSNNARQAGGLKSTHIQPRKIVKSFRDFLRRTDEYLTVVHASALRMNSLKKGLSTDPESIKGIEKILSDLRAIQKSITK